jgi:hypothetical protein
MTAPYINKKNMMLIHGSSRYLDVQILELMIETVRVEAEVDQQNKVRIFLYIELQPIPTRQITSQG